MTRSRHQALGRRTLAACLFPLLGLALAFTSARSFSIPLYHYTYTGATYNDAVFPPGPYSGGHVTLEIFSPILLQASPDNQADTPGLRIVADDTLQTIRYPDVAPDTTFDANLLFLDLGSDGLPLSWAIRVSFVELTSTFPSRGSFGTIETDVTGGIGGDRVSLGGIPQGVGPAAVATDAGTWSLEVTGVPEPATVFLLGAGLVLAAGFRRRIGAKR